MRTAYGREMYDTPENPVIANYLRTGYPDGKDPEYPRCPVCGGECETLYKDRFGDVVGCDYCITAIDAWEAEL